jgi:hypothetical protein
MSRTATLTISPRARAFRAPRSRGVLGRYDDASGRTREIVSLDALAGSRLIVDRRACDELDARLLAHLAADEPRVNGSIVCSLYLAQVHSRDRPRPVAAGDFIEPSPEHGGGEVEADGTVVLLDRSGARFELGLVESDMSIPELRWRRFPAPCETSRPTTVSVRDAIAGVEAYAPIRSRTRRALALHACRPDVSVAALRLELERSLCSPIVLNRKLRETALAISAERGISMSEIAIRCGRTKRDRAGNVSGETSWLARRLGILPEGGRQEPTRWIHIEVLALIARDGLGVSPREVEAD